MTIPWLRVELILITERAYAPLVHSMPWPSRAPNVGEPSHVALSSWYFLEGPVLSPDVPLEEMGSATNDDETHLLDFRPVFGAIVCHRGV